MKRISIKKAPRRRLIYPIQQTILPAGCSSAEPVSSFDLQTKNKKILTGFGRLLKKI
jgi:hypothetical protein